MSFHERWISSVGKLAVFSCTQLYALPDVEFVGCVGEALEFPQCFELFPDFDDGLQQSSVPLLLQVTELTSVPEETRAKQTIGVRN